MKALLHAYFWRQKVLPSDSAMSPQVIGNGIVGNNNSAHHKIHIQSVAMPPVTLSSHTDCGYDLIQNAIRSRRTSQISTKGDEMAPLCIEQDMSAAVAAYM